MNPRQRRGLLLLTVAGVGALLVFFAAASYISGVRSEAGQLTSIFRLADDVPAFKPVPVEALEEVRIPEAAMPPSAVLESEQLSGLVAATDLAAGSFVQSDMLVPRSGLRRGEREVAILVDAETGVAGRVDPGSLVDIYATFEGERSRCAALLVPRSRIVAVGVQREQRTRPAEGQPVEPEDVLPVTFALGPEDARKLVYAESFASEVRLALVGEDEPESGSTRTDCQVPSGVGT